MTIESQGDGGGSGQRDETGRVCSMTRRPREVGGPVPGSTGNRHLAEPSLAAPGVVFGDIVTTRLYAIREAFHGDYAIAVTPANVVGVLSLIL